MKTQWTTRRRLTAALLLALGALLAVPAVGSAATTFGSRFKNEPNTANCYEISSCSLVSYVEPVDPNGDPYAGGAPVSGVITSFQLYARTETPTPVTFFAANTQLNGGDDSAFSQVTATGPTTTIPATGEEAQIFTVPARVPVQAGQHIGISFSGELEATYNSSGDKFTYLYSPRLEVDRRLSDEEEGVTGELTLKATVEPDADGDGFGDETQDQCPTQAATHGPCVPVGPPADVTPPTVSGFHANSVGFLYTLSEAATVTLQLERSVSGRKSGHKCVLRTKKNAAKAVCLITKDFRGPFTGPGRVGKDQSTYGLLLPGVKTLPTGLYSLRLTATDAAGNSTKALAQFRVPAATKSKKKKPGH